MRPLRQVCAGLLLVLLAPALVAAQPRRTLHVSLYPYIPEAAAAALSLKQGFEREHPDVRVEITLNPKYYSLVPADKGVLYEEADVHEIDVVFLDDFLARHKLAPLPAGFEAGLSPLSPIARTAATRGGRLVAVPQWLCADFLIYRTDGAALPAAPTLGEVEQAMRPQQGLLINLSGSDALGELYLSALLARYGDPAAAVAHLTDTPDPQILARLHRLLDLEPAGFGRDPDYAQREDFYPRQFARRYGGGFVGYSELVHDALEESGACRKADHCVTAADIKVAPLPMADGVVRPMVWADMFGIDARVHGKALSDAQDFIRYAVSLPAYRALLIPEEGAPPRYLLPATQAPFEDPAILAAAPLYRDFHAIVVKGASVSAPRLTARLQAVATRIDADLPPQH